MKQSVGRYGALALISLNLVAAVACQSADNATDPAGEPVAAEPGKTTSSSQPGAGSSSTASPTGGLDPAPAGSSVGAAAAPAADSPAGAIASPATDSPSPGAVASPVVSFAAAGTMNIPTSHPRLWWSAERLASAKRWFAAHPFTPRADDAENLALHFVLTGNAQSARGAIDWLMKLDFNTIQTSSDPARWYGETAMLVFDWCHDVMTSAERATIIARWNKIITELNAKPWGGVGMEANNYYWGYLRNSIEWAVASYHENPQAPAILTYALETRWRDSFVPYAANAGRGGVPQEGSQYGRYTMSYTSIPMTTAGLLGQDLWSQTNFFKESLFYLLYATTPAATATRGKNQQRFEMFPFNDDEFFRDGGTAESPYYAAFLASAIERWRGTALAGYAQTWLNQVRPAMNPINAALFTPAAAQPLSNLPLDYYAPGNSYLYTRNRWAPDTTLINLQLGRANGTGEGGHEHIDWGGFQIWRAGRWLSRETTGYVDPVAGWKGTGTAECAGALAHNGGVLFDGVGIKTRAFRKGAPHTIRLESRTNHSYAAVDLSDAYRTNAAGPADRDNPLAKRVVREYLFVRPLEALVILDRVESTDEQKAAAGVAKTFLAHFETAPTIQSGNTVLDVNGDQALRLTTLVPSAPTYRVVDEGGKIGQFRVEIDTSGSAQSYFVNVLHARGAADPDLTTRVTETGDSFEVTLVHPTKGSAKVVFSKGMTSTGGTFGYAAAGAPALAPLTDRVQGIHVTDSGPVWE